jgi:hypothetical protein
VAEALKFFGTGDVEHSGPVSLGEPGNDTGSKKTCLLPGRGRACPATSIVLAPLPRLRGVGRREVAGTSPATTLVARPKSALWFPDHDDVQFARAVSAEDEGLLDIGGAGRAGNHVDGARHGVGAETRA